jgi:hypothetical protein
MTTTFSSGESKVENGMTNEVSVSGDPETWGENALRSPSVHAETEMGDRFEEEVTVMPCRVPCILVASALIRGQLRTRGLSRHCHNTRDKLSHFYSGTPSQLGA